MQPISHSLPYEKEALPWSWYKTKGGRIWRSGNGRQEQKSNALKHAGALSWCRRRRGPARPPCWCSAWCGITDPEHPVDVDRLLVVTLYQGERRQDEAENFRRADPPHRPASESRRLQRQQMILLPRRISSPVHGFCAGLLGFRSWTCLPVSGGGGGGGGDRPCGKRRFSEVLEALWGKGPCVSSAGGADGYRTGTTAA